MKFDEYQDRLERALEELSFIYDSYSKQANSGHPDSFDAINQQRRIKGKIEGVKLALSYWKEIYNDKS